MLDPLSIATEGLLTGDPLNIAMQGFLASEIIEIARPLEQAVRRVRGGSSSRRKDDNTETQVIISARLLSVRGVDIDNVKGSISVTFSHDRSPRVRIIEQASRSIEKDIVIRVTRVYRKGT